MNLKKALCCALAVAMSLSVMTACGKSDSSSSTASSGSSKASSETSSTVKTMNSKIKDVTGLEVMKEMKVGWNLGNTLDATGTKNIESETSWGCVKCSKEMVDLLKKTGFNVFRVPTTWQNHMDDNYNVDEKWMDRVQEVVNYGIENGMYVILNAHHEDWYKPTKDNEAAAQKGLEKLWSQIAKRFEGYDEHLIFEGMNEPRLKGDGAEWVGTSESREVVNDLNKTFIDTIRKSSGNNPKRILMIPGYAASSAMSNLQAITVPDDKKIIISVHAYLPYDFALNTAGTDKYDSSDTSITQLMDTLNMLFISQGTGVIIGEFGSVNKQNEADRVKCATDFITAAEKYEIPCIWWDNQATVGSGENFGLMDRTMLSWNSQSIVDALIKNSK